MKVRVTVLASLQWMIFIFVNVVVVPISIGAAFQLSIEEVVSILRISLIVTGLACILQAWIGHKYPILEGPSGIIWGMMLTLGNSAPSLGLSFSEVGGGIATGMLLAGATMIILAICRAVSFIQRIFKPMVMNVFLMLLSIQLAVIFFEGLISLKSDGSLNLTITFYSIIVVILVTILKVKGNKSLSNFSLLIGIIVGWLGYSLLFPSSTIIEADTASGAGMIWFPLGEPNLEIGIVIVTYIACLLNMSNTFVAMSAAQSVYQDEVEGSRYRNSMILTGAYSVIGSCFGLVAYAPFASAIGFLESTQIYDKKPFYWGGLMITLLGVFPALAMLLAKIPITVGNAVLFVAYLQLFGTALKSIKDNSFDTITIHRYAIPVLAGVSIMMTDAKVFSSLPALLQPLISNGFLVGVILSIILEFIVKWDRSDKTKLS